MQNNTFIQTAASAIFLAVALVFINPFNIWMTDMMHMFILGLLVVVFGVLVIFVVREKGGDEREMLHRMLAGRTAFLSGAAVLLIGVVWQAFTSTVDMWLVVALCVMVIGKISARIYGDRCL